MLKFVQILLLKISTYPDFNDIYTIFHALTIYELHAKFKNLKIPNNIVIG